ncbi:MAG: NTP transferase domain-containing protein, partial [Cellulomonadaceae bacterium]|nr:NTP transferase domain-containing protein [Cellulomonadaceae bacterium]
MSIPNFYAIVPAGGAGTRLWPLSRAGAPKFLLDLTGSGRTLIQATLARLAPLAEGIVIVTGQKHVAACHEQLPDFPKEDLLAEPVPRNSMAAIGLAAAVLQQRHGDVVVGSFAADQVVHGQDLFGAAVKEAVAAANAGYVATIGIAAQRPSTAFGYIESGAPLDVPGASTVLHAVGFTEKPDAKTATQYVRKGNYRWNAGIFVARTDVLLGHLKQQRPELYEGLMEIA